MAHGARRDVELLGRLLEAAVPGRRLEHTHGAQWWKLETHSFTSTDTRTLRQALTKTKRPTKRQSPGAAFAVADAYTSGTAGECRSTPFKIFSFVGEDGSNHVHQNT